MARASLPPGFRFHPTDVELVMYYLKRKVMGKKLHVEAIAEVNIYKFSPWDLPAKSCLRSKDLEWFFFCPRENKYASGVRVKRATENGFWKTTGNERFIRHNGKTVGTVKTLVFHLGHAPKGKRTDWVIHEYKILDDQLAAAGVQDTYVLCKVFEKSGPGPKNGAQYGAPFDEADWPDDDVDDAQNHALSLVSDGPSSTTEKPNCPPGTGLFGTGSMPELPLVEKGSSPSVDHSASEVLVNETSDDEILRLLESFTHEDMLPFNENEIKQDDLSGKGKGESLPCSDECDVYDGLGDLDGWGLMNEGTSGMQKDDYCLNNMPLPDNSAYIELDDLLDPLPCSAGVIGTDQSSDGEILGSYSHENMHQFFSGGSFAGMDQYAACADQLPVLPEGSIKGDNCLEVLQMVNNQFYNGSNAAYDLDYALGQLENGVNFTQDMERGRCADN